MFKNFFFHFQENKLTTWKYHRTQLWMEYCNREVILPSPFNLVNYAFDLVMMVTFSGKIIYFSIILIPDHLPVLQVSQRMRRKEEAREARR